MKKIKLKEEGEAVVDDTIFEDLKGHVWHRRQIGDRVYAARRVRAVDSTGKKAVAWVYLQREVMGLKIGDPRRVSFINSKTLDCRKENLHISEALPEVPRLRAENIFLKQQVEELKSSSEELDEIEQAGGRYE